METLKAKVVEFKENFEGPSWPLVGLSLLIAIPFVGGVMSFASFLVQTLVSPVLGLLMILGTLAFVYVIYVGILGFIYGMDATYVAKPVHEEEDYS